MTFKMKGFSGFGNSPAKQKKETTEKILSVDGSKPKSVTFKNGKYYTVHKGDTISVPKVHLSGGNKQLAIGDYIIKDGKIISEY